MFFVIFDIRHYVMKTKIILRDVTGQWILVLTTWCALVFGDLWPNLPGQPSLSPTMAETRAEQDRQNRHEGFEVLPNVTVLISFYLSDGGKKVLIHKEKSRFPFSATAYRDLEVLKTKRVRFLRRASHSRRLRPWEEY